MLEYLSYDPETGIVTKNLVGRHRFKTDRGYNIHKSRDAGKVVGSKNKHGYLFAMINGTQYPLHRLIWVTQKGMIPEGKYVDHINGVRDDNRWSNLDLVTWEENTRNSSARKDSTTGLKGVRPIKRGDVTVYQARIRDGKTERSLGVYATPMEAHLVYQAEVLKRRGRLPRTRPDKDNPETPQP